jgi:hypothetical protein
MGEGRKYLWDMRVWEDDIKMDFKETRREGMEWIHMAQNRVHWRTLVNSNEP